MSQYENMIGMALRLIAKYGQEMIWRKVENGTPLDPNKPWLPGDSAFVDYIVPIAILPNDRENRETVRYLADTTLKIGDSIGYMGQVTEFAPKAKDVIVRNGIEYVIENIVSIEPNNEGVILYILELGTGGQGN